MNSWNINRRQLLQAGCMGFGGLALHSMLAGNLAAQQNADESIRTHVRHFAPRAKRVIFLFMHGGPSHVDLFDPKPMLNKYDGKAPPFERTRVQEQCVHFSWMKIERTVYMMLLLHCLSWKVWVCDDDIARFEYLKKSARNYGTVLIGIESKDRDSLLDLRFLAIKLNQ